MAAKKLLTGCLVIVLLGVACLGAAWWFVLRPMWGAGGDLVSGAKEWASTLDLGEEITNDAPFEAPEDGRLTPAQVDALVKVQAVVAKEMGSDVVALVERARAAKLARGNERAPSMEEIAAGYRELAALGAKLRSAQAKGVNQAGLSRREYAFIRGRAIAAMPLLVDMGSLEEASGLRLGGPKTEAELAAAKYNADLLRPHLPLLNKTLGAGMAMPDGSP